MGNLEEPRGANPKTPLIAGIICGVCVGVAWAISFFNWVWKQYRRSQAKKLQKQRRRTREPSGVSYYQHRPRQRRTRSRTQGTYASSADGTQYPNGSSTDIRGASYRATAGFTHDAALERDPQDPTARISQPIVMPEENPRLHALAVGNASNVSITQGEALAPPRTGVFGRHTPSWVPEHIWNRRSPRDETPPALASSSAAGAAVPGPSEKDLRRPQMPQSSISKSEMGDDTEYESAHDGGEEAYVMSPVSGGEDGQEERFARALGELQAEDSLQTGRSISHALFGTRA
ncbi:hypothetical protein DL93DRAFT_2078193 [Clavulina sp. PMI_390]|nr:hypothetical protein DL93DRAFT_2078193 [Clavulina sp. PMI_390]